MFVLTDEMLKNAKTYIPLAEKAAFAETIAERCIEKAEASQNVPTTVKENMVLKSLLLMQVLLEEYLGISTGDNFYPKDYDVYAEAHLLNQIERYKKDAVLKNKAFDLLTDYKDFEKFVNTAIFNEKAKHNDALARVVKGLNLLATPENIEKLKENLEQLTKETK